MTTPSLNSGLRDLRHRTWIALIVAGVVGACGSEPMLVDAGVPLDAGTALDAGTESDAGNDVDGGAAAPSMLACSGLEAMCQGPPDLDGGHHPDDLFFTMLLSGDACGSSMCDCANEGNCPVEIYAERRFSGVCGGACCNVKSCPSPLYGFVRYDVERVFMRVGGIAEWSTSARTINCLNAFEATFPSGAVKFTIHNPDFAIDDVTGFTLTPTDEEPVFIGAFETVALVPPLQVPTPVLSACPEIAPASCQASPTPSLVAVSDAMCLLDSDCSVRCFDESGARDTPVLPFASLAGHPTAGHLCGLRADGGELSCFHQGLESTYYTFPGPEHAAVPLGDVQEVAVSYGRTCTLNETGALTCMTRWDTPVLACPFIPEDVEPLHGLASMLGSACALNALGFVACSSPGNELQLPTEVAFKKLAGGVEHVCGIRQDDQSLVCFGRNTESQASPPLGAFVDVSAGADLSCGIRADDATLACFGAPTLLLGVPTGSFTSVAVNSNSVCALRDDGEVICWGAETTWSLPACE